MTGSVEPVPHYFFLGIHRRGEKERANWNGEGESERGRKERANGKGGREVEWAVERRRRVSLGRTLLHIQCPPSSPLPKLVRAVPWKEGEVLFEVTLSCLKKHPSPAPSKHTHRGTKRNTP